MSSPLVTPDQTVGERCRRRVTRRCMPVLILAYLLAYIDRANVGVAKLQMQSELRLTDEIIGFGAGLFFIGYVLLEVPGSLLVERWSARKWLSRIAISWGLVAALTGLVGLPQWEAVPVKQQFYAVRLLLGVAEAGFFPGVLVYLSHWFVAADRARVKSYFMITQPFAVIVGVPLARLILETVDWGGFSGWRWVFILEGLPSVLVGLLLLFYLTDRVSQAKWLPEDEKLWLSSQLEAERRERVSADRVRILAAFRQPETFLLIAILFFITNGNQALLFFLPSVTDAMKSMPVGWRTFFTVLPYLCSAGGILLNAYLFQRTRSTRWHTAGPCFLAGTGLALAVLSSGHTAWTLAALCLAGAAGQAYLPVFWTIPTAVLGQSAAATAIGLINALGNLGGFVGPSIFGYLRTATGRFEPGLWFLTAGMFAAGLLASLLRVKRSR